MSYSVDTIDLSLRSPENGRRLTANIYYVDGVTDATGATRPLSIGQLVMAICLERAAKLESDIISLMNTMNNTTATLEALSEIETKIVDWAGSQTSTATYNLSSHTISSGQYKGKTYKDFLTMSDVGLSLPGNQVVIWGTPSSSQLSYDEFISRLEAKMDEKNSFSQQKMIELQSLTAKRDQSYDMISNILKSFNTVLIGNVNNM